MMTQIESLWPIYPHRSDYSQNEFLNHYTRSAENRSKSDKCFNIYRFSNGY